MELCVMVTFGEDQKREVIGLIQGIAKLDGVEVRITMPESRTAIRGKRSKEKEREKEKGNQKEKEKVKENPCSDLYNLSNSNNTNLLLLSEIRTESEIRTDPIRNVFAFWNSMGIIKHRDLTKSQGPIRSAVEQWGEEGVKKAIENYQRVLSDEQCFWSYRWPLNHFLQRGLDRFVPDNFNIKDFIRRENDGQHRTGRGHHPQPRTRHDEEIDSAVAEVLRGYRSSTGQGQGGEHPRGKPKKTDP